MANLGCARRDVFIALYAYFSAARSRKWHRHRGVVPPQNLISAHFFATSWVPVLFRDLGGPSWGNIDDGGFGRPVLIPRQVEAAFFGAG